MRLVFLLFLILLSVGCAVKPEPAPLLAMPEKPRLESQQFEVKYQTAHESPKVKSVQLPAHPVKRNQTVKIVATNTSVTDTLYQQLTDALADKQLQVTDNADSDYTLSIHQLELDFVEDTQYQLQLPENSSAIYEEIAHNYPSQQCATLLAQVSMRLTHQQSGDVVWFAKSSIDSASFHREPIIYTFMQQQSISNELEVASFVHEQNTEQARMARIEKTIEIPQYQTVAKLTSLEKKQGPCNRTEVSALTPMMQYYLSSILIDKIKVQ